MFDYNDVLMRLQGLPNDGVLSCLVDEFDILRAFLAEKQTLWHKHVDLIHWLTETLSP